MIKEKKEKSYIDTCFGFEVELANVPMVEIRGQWTPKINYKELAEVVLKFLIQSQDHLTGNHVKFIRHKLSMTLKDFGSQFGVSHAAVKKWEDYGDKPTNMGISTERDLKLFALQKYFGGKGISRIYKTIMNMHEEAISRVTLNETELALV
jgi:hypothetical protein